MAPGAFYGWTSPDLPKEITVDCFLPTGVIVPLECDVSASLNEIKTKLFKEAEKYPLFGRLGKLSSYCFLCINEKGKREQLLDEQLKLTDIRPFRPVLKLLERQNEDTQKDKKEIDRLIGVCRRDEGKDTEEMLNFRQKYLKISSLESQTRRQQSWEKRAMARFPCELCDDVAVPQYVTQKLRNGQFEVHIRLPPGKEVDILNIPVGTLPTDVIYVFRSHSNARKEIIKNIKEHCLKIVGKEKYFLGDHTMEEYKFISNVEVENELLGHIDKPVLIEHGGSDVSSTQVLGPSSEKL